jgi:GNAT superfamily N-acetyltransferase
MPQWPRRARPELRCVAAPRARRRAPVAVHPPRCPAPQPTRRPPRRPAPSAGRQDDCAQLFVFGRDVRLEAILEAPDRWYAVAATAGGADDRVLGFAAAAVGRVGEFPLEAPLLAAAIAAARDAAGGSGGGSGPGLADGGGGGGGGGGGLGEESGGGGVEAYEEDLVTEVVLLGVLPEWRRRRVATRLLGRVRAWARSRQCAAMCLHVQVQRRGGGAGRGRSAARAAGRSSRLFLAARDEPLPPAGSPPHDPEPTPRRPLPSRPPPPNRRPAMRRP